MAQHITVVMNAFELVKEAQVCYMKIKKRAEFEPI
jgi:hypothetical protein